MYRHACRRIIINFCACAVGVATDDLIEPVPDDRNRCYVKSRVYAIGREGEYPTPLHYSTV